MALPLSLVLGLEENHVGTFWLLLHFGEPEHFTTFETFPLWVPASRPYAATIFGDLHRTGQKPVGVRAPSISLSSPWLDFLDGGRGLLRAARGWFKETGQCLVLAQRGAQDMDVWASATAATSSNWSPPKTQKRKTQNKKQPHVDQAVIATGR